MIWSLLYWVLILIAVVMLLRGLLWDRAGFRGRPGRRCRKCWYDLTGVDGDVSREPVVCPECGKGHKTKRSMRKTRRGKRWILAAVGVWLMTYGASVTPRVQKHGWGAAVPRVVLVASLPFISEEPGSGLQSIFPFTRLQFPGSAFDQFVLNEIGNPTGMAWGGATSNERKFGWLSRRLVFLLAKRESTSTLTNSTHAKGSAYRSLITRFVLGDEATARELNWARQQLYVEFEPGRAFGPEEEVYASAKFRRLIQGGYRLQFGDESAVYQCSTPNSMWMNGFMPANSTVEYWVDRFLWDSVYQVERARGRVSNSNGGYPIGTGRDMGNGTGECKVFFRIFEYDKMIGLDRNDMSSWTRVAHMTREFNYSIDETRVVVDDSSMEIRTAIENNIKARLTVEYDRSRREWVPIVKLETVGSALPPLPGGLLLGGGVSINIVWADSHDPDGLDYLKGHWDNWWLWGAAEVEGVKIRVKKDKDSPFVDVETPARKAALLLARTPNRTRLPGELDTNYYRVDHTGKYPARVVLKIKCPQGSGWKRFGGLWAPTVYQGELVIEIDDWTPIELKRYIVNGTVPDHAFPGGG